MPSPHQVLVTASQLGHVLQQARKGRKMSQSALASRIGLSQSRVSHLELNAQDLSVAQLLAWCSALELELTLASRKGMAPAAPETDW
ncbi:helix-turn-helix transcriptional regulator [Zoogloea sp.]|uniref:helix-turn-helix domain-containing protein n=1 Tax=Zoogloea sp. TaxID=49181 RepID=UPI001AD0EABC|nr:helix-turn-helix transcriptional regulator [Zoogloea sp.]MBN8282759.1 helix-turn-helix transcriptional regulator [Zoogloea sp.]